MRSYVLRAGRMTASQSRAVDELWPAFGVEYDQNPLDLSKLFGREAPVIVEIGFGNGESLAVLAERNPQNNYLGIEVHPPGVGHLLIAIRQRNLSNIRLCRHDAVEVLEHQIPDNSLDGINLFFPDPWPKKRHRKRRIVQPEFGELAAAKLKRGGLFHLATDWEPYAQHMLEVLESCEKLTNTVSAGQSFCPRPESRPQTKFETRGQRLGHGVWDLVYRRVM